MCADHGISAEEIVQWGLDTLDGLKIAEPAGFTRKIYAELLLLQASVQLRSSQSEEAAASLRQVSELVNRFDASPDFSLRGLRFASLPQEQSSHDILGVTAEESIETLFSVLKEPELYALWKEIRNHE